MACWPASAGPLQRPLPFLGLPCRASSAQADPYIGALPATRRAARQLDRPTSPPVTSLGIAAISSAGLRISYAYRTRGCPFCPTSSARFRWPGHAH